MLTDLWHSVKRALLRVISVMWGVFHMQVFGSFAVAVTATGCLYFLDDNEVATKDGLTAAGALLCILNIAFVVVMSMLISKRGGPTVIKWAVWARDILVSQMRRMFSRVSRLRSRRLNSSTSINSSVSRSSSIQLGLLSRVMSRNASHTVAQDSAPSHHGVASP